MDIHIAVTAQPHNIIIIKVYVLLQYTDVDNDM